VFLKVPATPALADEVDGLGGAAREDDVLGRRRVDERAHRLAGAFVDLGRAAGERVRAAAMDIRVLVLVEERDPIDDTPGLLGRGRTTRRRRVRRALRAVPPGSRQAGRERARWLARVGDP